MTVYAPAGTRVTCLRGHHIATVKEDLSSGDIATPPQLDWHIPAPVPGSLVEPCPLCGEPYIGTRGIGAVKLHTEDGWLS